MTCVLSVGGSIVAPPQGPDVDFLVEFRNRLGSWLSAASERRAILVIGGGGPARSYQNALKEFWRRRGEPESEGANEALDWIGIAATRINARLVKAAMGELCADEIVTDPSAPFVFSVQVLVASGWKPGFSTDYDAVYLAHRFGAASVLNLSNIAKVFTADPKLNPNAKPIDSISWPEFRAIVGSTWIPGANLPFDPIASGLAQEKGIRVTCAAGRDLENLENILEGRSFVGTDIG